MKGEKGVYFKRNDEVDFIPSEDSLKEQFYNLVENYKLKLKDHREQVEKERDENLIKTRDNKSNRESCKFRGITK